jgi:ubiquinone/menaquinone biosynthesis C-methylase UbiE
MTVEVPTEEPEAKGLYGRLAEIVCRRAFSSPEALAYELTIAPSLAKIVAPEFVARVKGKQVLDVGCGGGIISELLANQLNTLVVGIDPSASQIRRVARRAHKLSGLFGVQARAEDLPFADNSFDYVVSSCAYKHWPDSHLGIEECLRVVRAGGAVILVEIDGSSTQTEFWRFARNSRIPIGMRKAYVRFAMRTVVGVAPTHDELVECVARSSDDFEVAHLSDAPFHIAVVTKSA